MLLTNSFIRGNDELFSGPGCTILAVLSRVRKAIGGFRLCVSEAPACSFGQGICELIGGYCEKVGR